MQKGGQSFHETENANCQNSPESENDPKENTSIPEKDKNSKYNLSEMDIFRVIAIFKSALTTCQ